jgi:magnesium chelatase family protein
MLSRIIAGTIVGISGVLVDVEVDVSGRGFPSFTIVGLPGKAIDEAKERVRTAITNADYEMPDSRITVNLAPADVPKSGTVFDLAIAVGIISASQGLKIVNISSSMFIGELSLEGQIRRVNGIIPLIILAKEKNIKEVYIPQENLIEATIFEDIEIFPVKTLKDMILHLTDVKKIKPEKNTSILTADTNNSHFDFSKIKGQEQAKRALEIAAAGFHNVHLRGTPGSGKTLLSRSMPGIMPSLSNAEMLEVAKIHSVAGQALELIFAGLRPFRSPHHTISRVGLIGGGSSPTPGEISQAHRGVLFLDEFPEYPRNILESLRQPLEDGVVTVSRASGTLTFPSRFLLLAASNPCPCGYLGHPKKACQCHPGIVSRYQKKISGPLLDRIDIHLDVPAVEVDRLSDESLAEASSVIKSRVLKAQKIQAIRFKDAIFSFNSEMSSSDVRKYCQLAQGAKDVLSQAVEKLNLSARSYFKIIKIGQTIADLDGSIDIKSTHILEALSYRPKGQ